MRDARVGDVVSIYEVNLRKQEKKWYGSGEVIYIKDGIGYVLFQGRISQFPLNSLRVYNPDVDMKDETNEKTLSQPVQLTDFKKEEIQEDDVEMNDDDPEKVPWQELLRQAMELGMKPPFKKREVVQEFVRQNIQKKRKLNEKNNLSFSQCAWPSSRLTGTPDYCRGMGIPPLK